MLSKVLSKKSCADCRFCCSFRRCSLWETPLFPKEECEKLSHDNEYNVIMKGSAETICTGEFLK